MNWILSGNINKYDVVSRLEEYSYVNWNQTRNYEIGDYVYIYLSGPIQEIRYKCEVTAINLEIEECEDDSKFLASPYEFDTSSNNRVRLDLIKYTAIGMSRVEMTERGILSRIQGPIRISDEVADYIDENYFENVQDVVYPDEINNEDVFREGQIKQSFVNKYERNNRARQRCLEAHGYNCKVCDFNFEDVFGVIGKEFIHVHHVKPISEIKSEYVIDPINDLIPVCPNCHAMLHSKKGDGIFSIEELKFLVNR